MCYVAILRDSMVFYISLGHGLCQVWRKRIGLGLIGSRIIVCNKGSYYGGVNDKYVWFCLGINSVKVDVVVYGPQKI